MSSSCTYSRVEYWKFRRHLQWGRNKSDSTCNIWVLNLKTRRRRDLAHIQFLLILPNKFSSQPSNCAICDNMMTLSATALFQGFLGGWRWMYISLSGLLTGLGLRCKQLALLLKQCEEHPQVLSLKCNHCLKCLKQADKGSQVYRSLDRSTLRTHTLAWQLAEAESNTGAVASGNANVQDWIVNMWRYDESSYEFSYSRMPRWAAVDVTHVFPGFGPPMKVKDFW